MQYTQYIYNNIYIYYIFIYIIWYLKNGQNVAIFDYVKIFILFTISRWGWAVRTDPLKERR